MLWCLAVPAAAQDTPGEQAPGGSGDTVTGSKIGRVHDRIHRARAGESLYRETVGAYGDYLRFKTRVDRSTGLSWSMDLSYLQQRGSPGGGSPAGQWLATPGLDWVLFDDETFGEGSVQVDYQAARYGTSRDGTEVQGALGLVTPVNDYAIRQNIFAQLTYTHALPGDRVHVVLGQYPFSNFDGNQYLNNQQRGFVNDLFTQNGSETYPNAGWGAYAQLNATAALRFAAGLQSAGNLAGATLSTKTFGDGGYAWFGYAQWSPQFDGLGSAQYSITGYRVPTVPQQSRSTGWSLNFVQNLNDTWAVFARANRAYHYVNPIRGSYAVGGAMNNPLGRSPTDQIGLAFGIAEVAPPPTLPPGARDEKVVEAYWNWTFANGLLLTPGIQYFRDPALDPTRDSVWVWSLRATLMF